MKLIISGLALATVLTGCSHKAINPSDTQTSKPMTPETKAILANPALKMVHFAFNRSNLTEKAKNILRQDASALKEQASLKFQIQGFCDDRGTVQYNLGLGERRAAAVRSYLEKLGVRPDRISIQSFGKADPLDRRENEAAYAINRRANFSINSIANRASL